MTPISTGKGRKLLSATGMLENPEEIHAVTAVKNWKAKFLMSWKLAFVQNPDLIRYTNRHIS